MEVIAVKAIDLRGMSFWMGLHFFEFGMGYEGPWKIVRDLVV